MSEQLELNKARYILRVADTELILGHRLSELCGHGPILEEDIAVANLALDCLGHANFLLELAGRFYSPALSADNLAYERLANQYFNVLLAELPNEDFAHLILKQLYLSIFLQLRYFSWASSSWKELAQISKKALTEVKYHVMHSKEWVLRLGDGTEESNQRMQQAIVNFEPYVADLFVDHAEDCIFKKQFNCALSSELISDWSKQVEDCLSSAKLSFSEPNSNYSYSSITGKHTEYLDYILADMQFLTRRYPGLSW